jgi:hypothetical protein
MLIAVPVSGQARAAAGPAWIDAAAGLAAGSPPPTPPGGCRDRDRDRIRDLTAGSANITVQVREAAATATGHSEAPDNLAVTVVGIVTGLDTMIDSPMSGQVVHEESFSGSIDLVGFTRP